MFQQHCFYLVANISPKKVCDKFENNSTLQKLLPVCNRNSVLLQLVGATFDSKVASLRTMRKKNLIILKSLQKKSLPYFVLFVCRCWHLSCQISIESVRNMLNGLTYDSAVFKIFLNIITICIIIEHYLIEILYEILISMAFIAIYAIKVPVWTRCYT